MYSHSDAIAHAWPLAAVIAGVALVCRPADLAAAQKPGRWEPAIRAFEARDKEHPPPKGALLFVGSSSIRGWDLGRSFPDLETINRGFGGSQIADSIRYADRIILPHRPRVVVLYAGDNDIAAGKSPEQVFADYRRFVGAVHAELPKTPIVFIAIKPSLARWSLWPKMRRANDLIREFAEERELLDYADIAAPMLGEDGRPRPELFVKDGLHLNAKGYAAWASVVRPFLK